MSKESYFAGIDVGTSYIKTVIINKKNEIVSSSTVRSDPILVKSISNAFEKAIANIDLSRSMIKHVTATGFGREKVSFANSKKTEISSHAKGVHHYFPKMITIIDIGGQDTKVIKIDSEGKKLGFKMNRKCAAGTGLFLEEIAYRLGISMSRMNKFASNSNKDSSLSSYCTVFASTEILSRIKEGEKVEDMVKSAFESVVRRIIEMDTLEGTVVVTGGVIAHNDMIFKILKEYVDNDILTPPYPQLTGAFGAALYAKEAENLSYNTINS